MIKKGGFHFGHKHIDFFDLDFILFRCKKKTQYIKVLDLYVNLSPKRYRVFKKSLMCVVCKCEATICSLDVKCDKYGNILNSKIGYFNFYGLGRDNELFMLTVDHIQPQSLGGKNGMYNLQTMCNFCNSKKDNDYNKL